MCIDLIAQRCDFISKEEYAKFESKAKSIMSVVKQVIGQEKINIQVRRAMLCTKLAPYDKCGEQSKTFVFAAKFFVDKTYEILTKKEN